MQGRFELGKAHRLVLRLSLDQVLCLLLEVEDVRLAVVDVVIDQVQAFSGMQIFQVAYLLPEKPGVFPWIRGGIEHQPLKALAPGVSYFIRA